MDREAIIEEMIKLKDNWYATEKLTSDNTFGECATDLDNLIERIAEQM